MNLLGVIVTFPKIKLPLENNIGTVITITKKSLLFLPLAPKNLIADRG